MGIIIFWLAKRFTKKDDELKDLSKEVIKLVALWEAKADTFANERKQFMEVLDDIVKVQTSSKEELLGKLKTAIEKIDQIIESHKNSANNELKEIKAQLEALIVKAK